MRRLILIALVTAVTLWAVAQRMPVVSPHLGRSYHRGGESRAFLDPLAFYDYSDFIPTEAYPAPNQPLIVVQSPPSAVPVPERTSAPAQPLLIELQGDRYVRVSGAETAETEMVDSQLQAVREPVANEVAPRAPATVLMFRDGRREEVSDYTIAGGALYVSGEYYATGAWNRKIELSSLNLPETIASNQSRGVKFRLPALPNEVVIGP